MLTKDRVGAGAAILAAVLGLALVLAFPHSEGGDDDAPTGSPTSRVVPAPGQVAPAPGGQVEQPAPAPGQTDTGDDDDG